GGKLIRALALRNAPIAERTWTHLTFTYDGSRKEEGFSLYVNGTAVPLERGAYGIQNANVVQQLTGSVKNDAPLQLGPGGAIADFRVFDRVITEEEARLAAAWPTISGTIGKRPAQLSDREKDALRLYYFSRNNSEYRKQLDELDKVNAERRQIQNRATTAIVMEERPNSKA